MKSDHNLKRQLEKAFETSPLLTDCNINVEVNRGYTTLTGFVDKYCKKDIAKKITKEVEGTKQVIDALSVVLNEEEKKTDDALGILIVEKFRKNFGTSHKDVRVTVKEGYVWLDGHLNWKFQRELAVECISCLDGIKGIENNIVVPESNGSPISEKDVLAAIYGDHSITSDIKVEIFGHKVILKGSVETINQKNLVTRLVRSVKGVQEVENFLGVDWVM